jgi:RNA polymerase sigma-70 factor (ECF subfamily)
MEGQKGNMNDLGKRLARGDEDAFDETVERYSRKVYGLCYRILRDQGDAEDITQEVFVRVYTKHKTFKGKSSLYTWIYRIALNLCFSHLKKRRAPTIPFDEVEGVLKTRTDNDVDHRELERLVAGAVTHLPPRQRAVFTMRFYDKMTFKEISEAMGTSVGGAKANHHFAVQRLKEILKEADPK